MAARSQYLIACEVFRPELEHLYQKMDVPIEFIYLHQGLHDTPDDLRNELQKAIDSIEEEYSPTEILLAYGFCGRGLYGIKTNKAKLILPKVHDCIPVLLGDGPDKEIRPVEYAQTYWLSAGWLKYSQVEHIKLRAERYQEYIELYGQDSADYLMEVELSWKQNYQELTLIYWDGLYDNSLQENAKIVKEDMKLPYKERKGSSWYLQELLDGGQDTNKFFHITPGNTLEINASGLIDIISIE